MNKQNPVDRFAFSNTMTGAAAKPFKLLFKTRFFVALKWYIFQVHSGSVKLMGFRDCNNSQNELKSNFEWVQSVWMCFDSLRSCLFVCGCVSETFLLWGWEQNSVATGCWKRWFFYNLARLQIRVGVSRGPWWWLCDFFIATRLTRQPSSTIKTNMSDSFSPYVAKHYIVMWQDVFVTGSLFATDSIL